MKDVLLTFSANNLHFTDDNWLQKDWICSSFTSSLYHLKIFFCIEGDNSKSAWYNIFAELDPLQNPDDLGGKNEASKKEKQAC